MNDNPYHIWIPGTGLDPDREEFRSMWDSERQSVCGFKEDPLAELNTGFIYGKEYLLLKYPDRICPTCLRGKRKRISFKETISI